jgi:hypothetical protein
VITSERQKRKEGAHMFSTCTQSDRVLTGEETEKKKERRFFPSAKKKWMLKSTSNISQININLRYVSQMMRMMCLMFTSNKKQTV